MYRRARGMLRIARRGAARRVPSLRRACRAVCWSTPAPQWPAQDQLLSFVPTDPRDFCTSLNMGGVASLALALTSRGVPTTADQIVLTLGLSRKALLDGFTTVDELIKIGRDYIRSQKLCMSMYKLPISSGTPSPLPMLPSAAASSRLPSAATCSPVGRRFNKREWMV